jgi:hypothetical protein
LELESSLGMLERLSIRIFVAIALGFAFAAFFLAPVPADDLGRTHLPALALEQVALYRLEVALLVFYGCLLLATPAFSGLHCKRLPPVTARNGK